MPLRYAHEGTHDRQTPNYTSGATKNANKEDATLKVTTVHAVNDYHHHLSVGTLAMVRRAKCAVDATASPTVPTTPLLAPPSTLRPTKYEDGGLATPS